MGTPKGDSYKEYQKKIKKIAKNLKDEGIPQIKIERVKELLEPKAGSPGKFKESYVAEAEGLTMLGMSLNDMADFWKVHRDTVHEWRTVYPEFSDAIKNGKENMGVSAVKALFDRSTGMMAEDITITYDSEGNEIRKTVTRKQIIPDVTAINSLLNNRFPGHWSNTQRILEEKGGPPPVGDMPVSGFLEVIQNIMKKEK